MVKSGLGVEFLLADNRSQSEKYCSTEALLRRQHYRELYPTALSVLECMDGRLNLPIMTNTVPGIIQPWRTIGGMFDLGWSHFGDSMTLWVDHSMNDQRDCLVLISYHFSKGSEQRSCKGFGYKTENALRYTQALKQQFERVYGGNHPVLYPVQIGIETDEDAIIVHGENSQTLHMSEISSATEILSSLERLFPSMSVQVRNDFAHLLEGNYAHIQETRASNRPIDDLGHKEWIIGIGDGYDWLHTPNLALLVGEYDLDLTSTVRTAADIVTANIEQGLVDPKRGVVLMSSSACWKPEDSMVWKQMVEKSNSLARLAYDALDKERHALILENLQVLSGVVDMNKRLFIQQAFPGPSLLQ